MLCASCQGINFVLVNNLWSHLERLMLVIFISIEQHIVHTESPRVQIGVIPAIDEL